MGRDSVGGEVIPIPIIGLIGTGLFLTFRLGFIPVRRLGHGFGVTTGKYDDPNEPGDVSHFQALSTALSATVGIGKIAGVARSTARGRRRRFGSRTACPSCRVQATRGSRGTMCVLTGSSPMPGSRSPSPA